LSQCIDRSHLQEPFKHKSSSGFSRTQLPPYSYPDGLKFENDQLPTSAIEVQTIRNDGDDQLQKSPVTNE
jgi:hypothetical protein